MNSLHRRLSKVELLANPTGFCPHAAIVRLYDAGATEDERARIESPENCAACGSPKLARINLIALPEGMKPCDYGFPALPVRA